ncbi:nose resistant to fluoxetine protein 6-like [Saccoglossus kowalevskii]
MCAREYHIRPGDVPAIFICVVLVAVIIAGTVYDALKRRKQRQTLEMNTSEQATCTPENQSTNADDAVISPSNAELNIESREMPKKCGSKCKEFVQGCLLSFSLCVNICKMMGTVHGKSSITCLNGIRVLSMFWIILFHSYLFVGQYYPTVGNFRYATEIDQGRTVVLWKGDLAVEAFLVLSGLLVSYLTLNQLHRRGGPRHLNWLLFYFHRYWRLTPVYIFVMMLYATLVIYVSDGPLWWQWYYVQAECAATIWEHILYLNNFIPFPGDVGGCFGWSWYLAVDMQLYWMSPIFIIVFYKSRNGGICLTALTTCFCIALSAYFATVQGMPFGVDRVKYRYPKHEEGAWLYTKPWYRLPNYLVGIVLGYILFKLNGKKVQINKYLNIFIWCCAFAVALSIVYGVLTSVAGIRISQGAAVLYITIHRLVFSVCVGWVVFACATGNGGPVNTILSWRIWLPLARMNYCAYLVHLVVIFIYTFSMKSLYYYSDLGFTLDFIGILVVTYSVSFVIAIAVELPMLELEKVIIPAKYRKVQPSKN